MSKRSASPSPISRSQCSLSSAVPPGGLAQLQGGLEPARRDLVVVAAQRLAAGRGAPAHGALGRRRLGAAPEASQGAGVPRRLRRGFEALGEAAVQGAAALWPDLVVQAVGDDRVREGPVAALPVGRDHPGPLGEAERGRRRRVRPQRRGDRRRLELAAETAAAQRCS